MSSSDLHDLSDKVGELTGNTPSESAAALLVAMRAARTREEAEQFASMLGLAGGAT